MKTLIRTGLLNKAVSRFNIFQKISILLLLLSINTYWANSQPNPPCTFTVNLLSQQMPTTDQLNGSFTVSFVDMTPPYTYIIQKRDKTTGLYNEIRRVSNQTANPITISGLGDGFYWVSFIDSRGCTGMVDPDLQIQCTSIMGSVSADNITCPSTTTTLTVTVTGGSGIYQYSLNEINFQDDNQFTVGAGTYTVWVRDDNKGCIKMLQPVTVSPGPICNQVCGNKNEKVIVCHKGNAICVSVNALPAHLAHGDYVGPCTDAPSANSEPEGVLVAAATKFQISSYPNPFSKSTRIQYTLPYDSKISIMVYDMVGRPVANLVNGERKAGTYNVDFNASKLGAGTFYYRVKAISKEKEFSHTGSMIQLK